MALARFNSFLSKKTYSSCSDHSHFLYRSYTVRTRLYFCPFLCHMKTQIVFVNWNSWMNFSCSPVVSTAIIVLSQFIHEIVENLKRTLSNFYWIECSVVSILHFFSNCAACEYLKFDCSTCTALHREYIKYCLSINFFYINKFSLFSRKISCWVTFLIETLERVIFLFTGWYWVDICLT